MYKFDSFEFSPTLGTDDMRCPRRGCFTTYDAFIEGFFWLLRAVPLDERVENGHSPSPQLRLREAINNNYWPCYYLSGTSLLISTRWISDERLLPLLASLHCGESCSDVVDLLIKALNE